MRRQQTHWARALERRRKRREMVHNFAAGAVLVLACVAALLVFGGWV